MTLDWSDLTRELSQWNDSGMRLPLWWRDDDAAEPSAALDRLTGLSDRLGLPVHLAVVPRFAEPSLADYCRQPGLVPVVHGWSHEDHATSGAKKAEFGTDVPRARHDIVLALNGMQNLFGTQFAPMFVPPWNRMDAGLFPELVKAGFTTVSVFTPRKVAHPVPNLTQVNCHIDPIDWRGTRDLLDPAQLIRQAVQLLSDRRKGVADNDEPLGYLSHHLVHTEAIWDFTEQFFQTMMNGPVDLYSAPLLEAERS